MKKIIDYKGKSNLKTKNGITLIALVITIIVLLILAGVTVATITGENGLLSKAQLAKERNIEAEQDEKDKLSSYENEINNYDTWERTGGTVTLTDTQYNNLVSRIETLEAKVTPKTLWTGSTSSGKITLNNGESIYNYNFIIVHFGTDSFMATIKVNKQGMTTIYGGTNATYTGSNGIECYGFYISEISEDGKELTLTRSGYCTGSAAWNDSYAITKIEGIL